MNCKIKFVGAESGRKEEKVIATSTTGPISSLFPCVLPRHGEFQLLLVFYKWKSACHGGSTWPGEIYEETGS